MNSLHVRHYLAELVGTFVLVFGGVGSAMLAGPPIGFTGMSLAFGLSLLAMVYTIGPISGCHVNLAVRLGALITSGLYLGIRLPAIVLPVSTGSPISRDPVGGSRESDQLAPKQRTLRLEKCMFENEKTEAVKPNSAAKQVSAGRLFYGVVGGALAFYG